MNRDQPEAQFKLEGTPYDVEQMIGIGAYGQVRQAVDRVGSFNSRVLIHEF
jgi:hypothetical protein